MTPRGNVVRSIAVRFAGPRWALAAALRYANVLGLEIEVGPDLYPSCKDRARNPAIPTPKPGP